MEQQDEFRIQDFPEWAPTPEAGAPTYYFAKLAEICIKIKEFGPREAAHVPGTPPPLWIHYWGPFFHHFKQLLENLSRSHVSAPLQGSGAPASRIPDLVIGISLILHGCEGFLQLFKTFIKLGRL